jgi:DegV family protein with EDD domain
MQPVAVVTDTTCYLPADLVAAEGLHLVSLYVNDSAGPHRESDLTDLGAFYGRLRDAQDLPTTSQPSVGDFLEVLEPLVQGGQDVVCAHISGGLSGTVESARQAAADLATRFPDRRVEVLDTRSTAGGLGMIALAAARAARAGGDVDAVRERTESAIASARIWFAVDTLEYLKRGGRIGGAQALIGGALKIKPLLTLDGQITPVERVRTAGRAFERLVAFLESRRADGAEGWVVQHIRADEQAARLVERGRELLGSEPLFVGEIGPVIGAHVGPGLLGVGGLDAALVA